MEFVAAGSRSSIFLYHHFCTNIKLVNFGHSMFLYEQCCGSGIFMPDRGPNFSIPYSGSKDPGSGSTSKKLNIFKPKKIDYELSEYEPRFSSRIPDSGVKKAHKGTGSRFRLRNTVYKKKVSNSICSLVACLDKTIQTEPKLFFMATVFLFFC